MTKPLIFISYIHEDEDFAVALRDWVNGELLGGLMFFIAGDRGSIPLGTEWPQRISDALRNCTASLLILSPEIVDRKWVYFEAGAAFARQVPVIPVCCKGMKKADLTPPLSFLQAVELSSADDEKTLISQLARLCGLSYPLNLRPFVYSETRKKEILPPIKKEEGSERGILDGLFTSELSKLVIEWRDKLISKVTQLETSDMTPPDRMERLRSYLLRLAQERQLYIQETKQQMEELPHKLRQQNPEGGLHVELGIGATVIRMGDYIKASQSLLEVVPDLVQVIEDQSSTLEMMKDIIKSRFENVLFQIE